MKFCLAFRREALSVPVTRRVLGDVLRAVGVAEDSISDILLAATEACSNVLRHGGPRVTGYAVVVTIGSACFAAGVAWWAIAAGPQPDYPGAMLGGMLLTGIGVGLTLPTLMATAAASLPPPSFATGSAVVNMIRQIGLVIGVAVLVAVLGPAGQGAALLAAFQRAWWVTAAIAMVSVIPALLYLPRGRSAAARRQAGRPAAAGGPSAARSLPAG